MDTIDKNVRDIKQGENTIKSNQTKVNELEEKYKITKHET